MNVLPVTQARKKLLQLVDEIDSRHPRIDLTKHGRVKAALVSIDYLNKVHALIESMEETAEIHAIPGAGESIRRGLLQAKKRQGIKLEALS